MAAEDTRTPDRQMTAQAAECGDPGRRAALKRAWSYDRFALTRYDAEQALKQPRRRRARQEGGAR